MELYLSVLASVGGLSRRAERPTPPAGTFEERVGALGDALEGTAADVTAAQGIFSNVEEYLWVKERVLEAEAAVMTAKLNVDTLALLEKTLAGLRSRRAEAGDEGSRMLLGEQISSFEAELERTRRESREKEPEAVRANVKTLEPYRPRLAALQSEIDRLAPVVGRAPAARKGAPPPKAPPGKP